MTTKPTRSKAEEPDKPPAWRVEGMPRDGDDRREPKRLFPTPPGGRWFWVLLMGLLAFNVFISNTLLAPDQRIAISYSDFLDEIDRDNVVSVSAIGETIQATLSEEIADPDDENLTSDLIETERPTFAQDDLLSLLRAKGIDVTAEDPDFVPLWQQIVFGFGPTLFILWLFFYLFRRAGSALGGGALGLGKSRAKRYEDTGSRTTFDDVAGIEDAEEELAEIVDFLRNPGKYTALGGRIPKGVLLSGQPGTGKTLLARAVAGEAAVPFFSMSASEFIEMVVGVGASRVRDLFTQAKEVAPAIIFIDELDAIGRSRSGSGAGLGGHDEREQTLNQILTEMDGFDGSEGVIVIGATNRPEILDAALLRPGRFDRQVPVSPPDQAGRKKILEVHTRKVPLGEDVDLNAIASTTPGMVGADLANLVNEAALMAARRSHERVMLNDFSDALEKIVLGTERRIMMSQEEKTRTAYHESGHALLGMLQPGADPVRKISIIPRGRALGVTLQSPDADKYSYGVDYLRGKIIGMLGGRAAEQVIFGNVSTGAENDMVQATGLARSMVGRWGMSERIGPVTIFDERTVDALGKPLVSEATLELVDSEIRVIIDECYDAAVKQLHHHRDQLEALTAALLDKETLEEAEAYEVAGIERGERGG
ncbi:MAG TPA: ATP-dependent zinc metalloprotease FtsH [Acidimicrobiia bacterium]|nr:ATP-dependent zinc metalloprotease FtsH [Acidimicrobiia bacterium]